MSYSDGTLWLLTTSHQVIPFETSSDTLGRVVPLSTTARTYSITAVGPDAWVSLYQGADSSLLRIDGATLKVSRPYGFVGIAGFAAGGNGVWALTDDGL